jgi:hypothetical protein
LVVRDLGLAEGSGEEEGERWLRRRRLLVSSECLLLETVRVVLPWETYEDLRLSSREEESLSLEEAWSLRLLRLSGLMGVGPASMRSS